MTDTPLDKWRGRLGDQYVVQNPVRWRHVRLATAGFRRIFQLVSPQPASVLEVGANIGTNLRALRAMTPASLYAVEPNERARRLLSQDGVVAPGRILDGHAGAIPLDDRSIDVVFTCSVLMCIPDRDLASACHELYRVSGRWLLSIEYYAEVSTALPYWGHEEMLFKRDYRSVWLDIFRDLRCVGNGDFLVGRWNIVGPKWWLFEKERTR